MLWVILIVIVFISIFLLVGRVYKSGDTRSKQSAQSSDEAAGNGEDAGVEE